VQKVPRAALERRPDLVPLVLGRQRGLDRREHAHLHGDLAKVGFLALERAVQLAGHAGAALFAATSLGHDKTILTLGHVGCARARFQT